jgi:RNA polymerase sigma-B factor
MPVQTAHPTLAATDADGADSRSDLTASLFVRIAATDDELERRRLLDEVVLANLGVADAIARRYRGRGTSADDLEQVARLALVKAAASFHADLGHDFLSYAVPTIRGEVRRWFRDHGWMVRPPRRVQEAQLLMTPYAADFALHEGRDPRVADYVRDLDLDERTVVEALRVNVCYSPDSLDRPADTGVSAPVPLGERLAAEDSDFERCEARHMLEPLLAKLPPRDRTVLRLRFVDGLTQREVGERIGVTQMQVSRIIARLLGRLRDELGVVEAA